MKKNILESVTISPDLVSLGNKMWEEVSLVSGKVGYLLYKASSSKVKDAQTQQIWEPSV